MELCKNMTFRALCKEHRDLRKMEANSISFHKFKGVKKEANRPEEEEEPEDWN